VNESSGRTYADVIVDGERLAETLLRHGLATVNPKFAGNDAALWSAQEEAKRDNKGLWSNPTGRKEEAANRQETWKGSCIRIIDGDDIVVLCDGVKRRVRLYGIDAPEWNMPFGPAAKKQLRALTHKQEVEIEQVDFDKKHNRPVAWVRVKGLNVNQEMVCRGFAWWYPNYAPNESALEQCEKRAREERKGLWQAPNPIPPWEWRDKVRKAAEN